MGQQTYEEKGYLLEDFRIFYLEELVSREIEYHHHTFDKILIFFKGNIEYTVEGKSYTLLPNDVLLIPRGTSHKLNLALPSKQDIGYTRMVIYLSPEYLANLTDEGHSLRDCFIKVGMQHSHAIRFAEKGNQELLRLIDTLKEFQTKGSMTSFHSLYQQTLLLQFLMLLNQKIQHDSIHYIDTSHCNEKIVEIIHYINDHLTDNLDIDSLASHFYISKYHMMRQFKAETGYTIGNYITQKRLLVARELLKRGVPVAQVCQESGFHEYSTFSRAYKQMFLELPSKIKK